MMMVRVLGFVRGAVMTAVSVVQKVHQTKKLLKA